MSVLDAREAEIRWPSGQKPFSAEPIRPERCRNRNPVGRGRVGARRGAMKLQQLKYLLGSGLLDSDFRAIKYYNKLN